MSDALQFGKSEFKWGSRTYIMGIINATPDSFSGDGLVSDGSWVERAVAQGKRMVEEGAHMLDLGGESTRPGAEAISQEEELRRVLPVLKKLARAVAVPLSIDTYRAEVARPALDLGASLINDVWGGQRDPGMYALLAERQVPVILMHNRSNARNVSSDPRLGGRYVGVSYRDVIADVARDLRSLAEHAQAAGVSLDRIIFDPGFGFGKTVEQNREMVRRFAEFAGLGHPLLAGVSRKSFVGYTLDVPPHERLEGTIAASVLCAERGADIIRVHDVRAAVRALLLTDAVVRGV